MYRQNPAFSRKQTEIIDTHSLLQPPTIQTKTEVAPLTLRHRASNEIFSISGLLLLSVSSGLLAVSAGFPIHHKLGIGPSLAVGADKEKICSSDQSKASILPRSFHLRAEIDVSVVQELHLPAVGHGVGKIDKRTAKAKKLGDFRHTLDAEGVKLGDQLPLLFRKPLLAAGLYGLGGKAGPAEGPAAGFRTAPAGLPEAAKVAVRSAYCTHKISST